MYYSASAVSSQRQFLTFSKLVLFAFILGAFTVPAWAKAADVGDAATLGRAVSAASADIDVINITKDITHDALEGLGIQKSVTINLNGHTLTAKRITRIEDGQTDGEFLTVRNGTLNSSLVSHVGCTLTLEDAEVTANPYDVSEGSDDGIGGALAWSGALVLKNSHMTVNAGTIAEPMNAWFVPAVGDMLDIDDQSWLRIGTIDTSQMQGFEGMWFLLRSGATGDEGKEDEALTEEYWDRLGDFFPDGYTLYAGGLGDEGVLLLVTPDEGKDPTSITLTKRYAVTVKNGTGGGKYMAGESVTVGADAAPTGQEFDKWTSEDGVTFADATSATTTFTMPAKAVTVTANYKSKAATDNPSSPEPETGVITPSPESLIPDMTDEQKKQAAGTAADALEASGNGQAAEEFRNATPATAGEMREAITQATTEEAQQAANNATEEMTRQGREVRGKPVALGTVTFNETRLVFLAVTLPDSMEVGDVLAFFKNIFTGSNAYLATDDGDVTVFLDSAGKETKVVPEDRKVTAVTVFEGGKTYQPVIVATKPTESNDSGSAHSGCELGFGALALAVLPLLLRKRG